MDINIGGSPSYTISLDSSTTLEPSDTYKCPICNVNVPTMCYEKHNESDLHETIKKIYQKVLEGVSKLININIIHNKQDIGKDVYYCAPCSKIIKIENKQDHEDGDYHAKSLKDLIITKEFYEILKEKESYDESEVNKTVISEVNEAALGEVGDLETNRLNANDSSDINNLNLEVRSSIDSDDELLELLDDMDPEQKEKLEVIVKILKGLKKKSFEEYLEEVIKKFNLNINPPVVNGEFISIVAPNGDKVQVSREHFHSYRDIGNDQIYCQLCNKKWMSKYTTLHDVSEVHVRNIFKPIDDKFARRIDTISSHCVPCNEICVTEHHTTFNEYHEKIIKDTRIPTTKPGKTFCKECNLYVDTYNFSVHLNSKKHLSGSKQNSKLCKICNLTVSENAWKKHIRSKQHLSKNTNDSTVLSNRSNDSTVTSNSNNASTEINNESNASTSTNKSPVVIKVNDSGYCGLCKVKVPNGGMKIHVDGKSHKRVVSNLCSKNQNDTKPKGNKVKTGAKTGSVNTDNTASTSGISDNVASPTPGSSTAPPNLPDWVFDVFRNNVRCKICSVFIPFVNRNIIEHLKGSNHKRNAKKIELR